MNAEIVGGGLHQVANSLIVGVFVASAFIIGSLVAIYVKYSPKIKGDFAAFGAGVFLAAIAFSLIDEALKQANVPTMIFGFALGAAVYSITNHYIRKKSKYKKEKQSENRDNRNKGNDYNKKEKGGDNQDGSSQNVIVGTILDSIPETLFVGVIIAMQLHGLIGAAIALFLGNLGATLNGAKLMIEQGQSKPKVIRQWVTDFAVVAAAGPVGYYLVKPLSGEHMSIIMGFAAGTLMIFVSRELIPQAYKEDSGYVVDVSIVTGFLVGFVLFHFL